MITFGYYLTACLFGLLMCVLGYNFTTLVFWLSLAPFTIVNYVFWHKR